MTGPVTVDDVLGAIALSVAAAVVVGSILGLLLVAYTYAKGKRTSG